MEKYDSIGKTYGATRRADPRIVQQLIKLIDLAPGSTLADVGAGTGNYSVELAIHGYNIIAVEPSSTMRDQGKAHLNLHWLAGSAESLPLEDKSVDGVVCTLAVHHFADVERGFREIVRVVRSAGSIVLFVSDPRLCPKDCWLADYFEPIFKSYETYPRLSELVDILSTESGSQVYVEPFLLPPDMKDRFFMTGWRHPEWYLNPLFRQGVSPLAKASEEVVDRCVGRKSMVQY